MLRVSPVRIITRFLGVLFYLCSILVSPRSDTKRRQRKFFPGHNPTEADFSCSSILYARTKDNNNKEMFDDRNLSGVLSHFPDPRHYISSYSKLIFTIVLFYLICNKEMTFMVIYNVFRVLFGTLYPAYASFKAVRTKNVREYVSVWFLHLRLLLLTSFVFRLNGWCTGLCLHSLPAWKLLRMCFSVGTFEEIKLPLKS